MAIILPPGYLYFDGLKYTTNATIATAPLSGDVSGNINSNIVTKINGAAVPSGGFLTTGNVLQASGLTTLSYGPINLAGGSNYIAGVLPLSNYAVKKTITSATSSISIGSAVISNGNNVTLANSTYLLANNLAGIALTGGTAGQDIQIITNGLVDSSIINLGAGFRCAVGCNSSGAPVRVTDPACVSRLNFLGWCSTAGTIFVAPRVEHVYNVRDFGAVGDTTIVAGALVGTDDTAAIQSASAAMRAANNGPGTDSSGWVLYFPRSLNGGMYTCSTPIDFHTSVNAPGTAFPGTTLRGDGSAIGTSDSPPSALLYTGAGSATFIDARSTVGFTIEGLAVLYWDFTGKLVDFSHGPTASDSTGTTLRGGGRPSATRGVPS